MDAAGLRKRLTQSLLEDINEVQFPSVTMMNRVESGLATQEDLADYIEVLGRSIRASRCSTAWTDSSTNLNRSNSGSSSQQPKPMEPAAIDTGVRAQLLLPNPPGI